MGKNLIIKGADFSTNGLLPLLKLENGLINFGGTSDGALAGTSSAFYNSFIRSGFTIELPAGKTLTIPNEVNLGIKVRCLIFYDRELVLPANTSASDNMVYKNYYDSALMEITGVLSYTNNTGAVQHVALNIKKLDNTAISIAEYPEIEYSIN